MQNDIAHQIKVFEDEFTQLPDDITIATITMTCKLNVLFNVTNIAKYIDLKISSIIGVQHGKSDDHTTNRSLVNGNIANKKARKKAFYNQATLIVKTYKNDLINVKLFKNGSIQMTGCKSYSIGCDALKVVFEELKCVKAIPDYISLKMIEKPYVDNLNELDINKVYDLKICMINSTFNIGFGIDRDKLFALLIDDHYTCTYDPSIHAGVNIKFEHNDRIISVFVFESGAVIITGAKTCNQIIAAYNFINKYLLMKYENINKNNSLTNSTIMDFLKREINNQDDLSDDEYIEMLNLSY